MGWRDAVEERDRATGRIAAGQTSSGSSLAHNECMIDRRLLVLRALAEHGTVTATADALNYTPSAVSAQLRGLAEQLGVDLLEPTAAASG